MPTLNVFLDGTSPAKRLKAPKNTMFLVSDIHGSVLSSGANTVSVINELLEDELEIIQADTRQSGMIAAFSTAIAGNHVDFNFMTPQKSKFLTVARSSSTAFNAIIIIVYELIKATKPELIVEWFRKGR